MGCLLVGSLLAGALVLLARPAVADEPRSAAPPASGPSPASTAASAPPPGSTSGSSSSVIGSPAASEEDGSTRRTAGLALLGGGAILTGVGIVFALQIGPARNEANGHCVDLREELRCDAVGVEAHDRADRHALFSGAFLVTGIGALIAGEVLFVTSLGKRISASPVVSPRSAGLALQARW